MADIFYTSRKEAIRLGRKLGAGGEGEVFEVRGENELAAKIYYESPPIEKCEKLIALTRLGTERLNAVSAWPVDVCLSGPGGPIVGFVMRKIGQAEEIHALQNPKSRLQKFPEASWPFLIDTAKSFARAVTEIHRDGFVIGDLNPKNTLVTKNAAVYFLDCDSFQLSTKEKTHRCRVGFPEYTAPELHGMLFGEIDLQPEHDSFGLAVVIFQLLFLGRHPFSGRFLGEGEMSLEQAIKEYRFAYGEDARSRFMEPPPGAMALEAVPSSLEKLFRRSFLSSSSAGRPQPREWISPLDDLAKGLKQCAFHTGHQFSQALNACPWCEIEAKARVRLFNFAHEKSDSTRDHFKLGEIWEAIERIPPPLTESINKKGLLIDPTAAEKTVDNLIESSWIGFLSVVFSILAGFIIPLVTPIYISALLILFAGFLALKLVDLDLSEVKAELRRFSSHSTQETADALRSLEMKWRVEASEKPFLEKFAELQSYKQTYESLSQIRSAKLQTLQAVFDPCDSSFTLARIEAEKEIDRMRFRLEDELTLGAFHLGRLKQEIEESRRHLRSAYAKVFPSLVRANRAQAAEKMVDDCYYKSRSVLLLFSAFVTASCLETIKTNARSENGCINNGCLKPVSLSAKQAKPEYRFPLSEKIISIGSDPGKNEGSVIRDELIRKADLLGLVLSDQLLKDYQKIQFQDLWIKASQTKKRHRKRIQRPSIGYPPTIHSEQRH